MGVDVMRRRTHFRGKSTGVREDIQIYLTEVTITVTEAESGKTFIATKAGDQDFILPSAAKAGLKYTFVAGIATGEITIQVNGNDTVAAILEPGAEPNVALTTSAGKGIINTAASNILGDSVTLISDGVSRWYAVHQIGIFKTEP